MSADSIHAAPNRPAKVRSLRGLGAAVVVLLGLVIAADVFAVVVGARLYALWSAEALDQETFSRWEGLYNWSDVATMDTFLLCGVVFLVWFHRARINAEAFAPGAHRMTPAWAVWSWIVPVVNLWIPRLIALDIWSASTPGDRTGPAPRRSNRLVNAWWTLWIAGMVPTFMATMTYARAVEADETREAIGLTLVSALFDIAAAVLAIVFVRRLTAMQHRKALGQ
ncbi:DUF4328 domain-containing protein [Streptomyces sp. NPDC007861]|uniref:DUF4328 domain-containing protein n=1 Tax=Streptomyces sp. NPDC007861 TaxID=3154893 RepID=UPI0033E453AF